MTCPPRLSSPIAPRATLTGHTSWIRREPIGDWSMRLGFDHYEGLVIHRVGFDDGTGVRPIAHRLSFAAMVVPYRDPSPDHHRRTAFDIGEWGLWARTPTMAWRENPACIGSVTATICTIPASSRRWIRYRTAASDRPTVAAMRA